MSKRRGARGASPDAILNLGTQLTASMFPVQCSGEGCGKRSSLMLPGDSPYRTAMFLNEGWTVIVGDDPPSLDFFCRDCYNKVVQSGDVDDP
ncbi:MAG: hypothetical protein WAN74_06305 [Thermoplasmata archaeon]